MAPKSLALKANALGEGCDKMVQEWKHQCESVVNKRNCFQFMKDHFVQVTYLPHLPCLSEVKQFQSEV